MGISLLEDTCGQTKCTEAQFSKSSPGEQPQKNATEHPTSRQLVISVHGHLQVPQVPARRTLGGEGLSSLCHRSVFPGQEGNSLSYFQSQLSTCLVTLSPHAPCCESRRAQFLGLHPRSRATHAGDGGPRGKGLSLEWEWDSRPTPLTPSLCHCPPLLLPASVHPQNPYSSEEGTLQGGGLWWFVGPLFCAYSQTDSQT